MSDALRIFYDCEFTSLTDPSSDLLSVGFVSAHGDELYVEITDWDYEYCVPTDFVVDTVMPLFGRHNPERLTRDDAAKRIDRWINSLRTSHDFPVELLSDSQLDWQFLSELFVPMPGQPSWPTRMNINPQLIHWKLMNQQLDRFFDLVDEYHSEHHEQHHALADARAMKWAMERIATK